MRERRLQKLSKKSNSEKTKEMEMLKIQKTKDQAEIKRLTQQIRKLKQQFNQSQFQQKPKQKRYRVMSHSKQGTNVRFENDLQDTFLTEKQFQQLDPEYKLLE